MSYATLMVYVDVDGKIDGRVSVLGNGLAGSLGTCWRKARSVASFRIDD